MAVGGSQANSGSAPGVPPRGRPDLPAASAASSAASPGGSGPGLPQPAARTATRPPAVNQETAAPSRADSRRVDGAGAPPGAVRRPVRRVRHKLRQVDLWSVLKISLCFYTAAMLIVLGSGIALWLIADAVGLRSRVEKLVGDLVSAPDYHIIPGQVLEGAALIGVVFVALLVILTVVGAALYNVFSDLFGGIEFTTIEEEIPVRRRPS